MRIIQVDFNSRDEGGRVWLTLPCSLADLNRLGTLRDGDAVYLTDGEGFVRAKLTKDGEHWLAVADWDTWKEIGLIDNDVRVGESLPVRRAVPSEHSSDH